MLRRSCRTKLYQGPRYNRFRKFCVSYLKHCTSNIEELISSERRSWRWLLPGLGTLVGNK